LLVAGEEQADDIHSVAGARTQLPSGLLLRLLAVYTPV